MKGRVQCYEGYSFMKGTVLGRVQCYEGYSVKKGTVL